MTSVTMGNVVRVPIKTSFGSSAGSTTTPYINTIFMGIPSDMITGYFGINGLLTASDYATLPIAVGPLRWPPLNDTLNGVAETTVTDYIAYEGSPPDLYCRSVYEMVLYPETFVIQYAVGAARQTELSQKHSCPVGLLPYNYYYNSSYFRSFFTSYPKLLRPLDTGYGKGEAWFMTRSSQNGYYCIANPTSASSSNVKSNIKYWRSLAYQPFFNLAPDGFAKVTSTNNGYLVNPTKARDIYMYNGANWVSIIGKHTTLY